MRDRARFLAAAAVLLVLAAVPPVAAALGQPFYLDLVRRIMIFAIAALITTDWPVISRTSSSTSVVVDIVQSVLYATPKYSLWRNIRPAEG